MICHFYLLGQESDTIPQSLRSRSRDTESVCYLWMTVCHRRVIYKYEKFDLSLLPTGQESETNTSLVFVWGHGSPNQYVIYKWLVDETRCVIRSKNRCSCDKPVIPLYLFTPYGGEVRSDWGRRTGGCVPTKVRPDRPPRQMSTIERVLSRRLGLLCLV